MPQIIANLGMIVFGGLVVILSLLAFLETLGKTKERESTIPLLLVFFVLMMSLEVRAISLDVAEVLENQRLSQRDMRFVGSISFEAYRDLSLNQEALYDAVLTDDGYKPIAIIGGRR